MKKQTFILSLLILITYKYSFSGNPSRVGESGASILQINPWARSSGKAGANTAGANGAEAINLNVAGIAFIKKTDFMVTSQQFFVGSGTNVNSFGYVQKIKEKNAFALVVTNKNFGLIEKTDENNPEGLDFSINVNQVVINLAFARKFSKKIAVGLNLKVVNESLDNVSSTGFGFDGGIRYSTGLNNRARLGITLRNVGPATSYNGDGLSVETINVSGASFNGTLQRRSKEYELPVQLNIGVGYDFFISKPVENPETKEVTIKHKVTASSTFSANAFSSDEVKLGGEYSLKDIFFLRAGYFFLFSSNSETFYTGPSAGVSFKIPFGRQGRSFILDYSLQLTKSFNGTHSIGFQLSL